MVLAHSRALKTGGNTAVIEADLRNPASILDHPRSRALIDFSQPLAVLLVAILHFIGGSDDPYAIVGSIRDTLQPGSHLVISHATGGILQGGSAVKKSTTERMWRPGQRSATGTRSSGSSPDWNSSSQVPHWRPDEPELPDASKVRVLGGVGRVTRPEGTQRG
jgi:hypothetical protein